MSKHRVVIFTEGDCNYGYGHLIRCMALYDELVFRGYAPQFVINGDETISAIMQNRNYTIDQNWYRETEAYCTSDECVVVDSYVAESVAYEKIARVAKRALYIDDTNRLDYPKGIIVTPSMAGVPLNYNKRLEQVYLWGEQYVILRKEFCTEQVCEPRIVSTQIDDLLILMGGADVKNLTPKIIEALSQDRWNKVNQHVVIGNGFANVREIEAVAALGKTKLYYNLEAEELCSLMKRCDLAVSAAGQTVHELIAMELPFLIIKVIDNQENNVKGLLERGIINDYFDFEKADQVNINTKFIDWLRAAMMSSESAAARSAQMEQMGRLHIKGGVQRILQRFIGEK